LKRSAFDGGDIVNTNRAVERDPREEDD
jgi:hypothetical protein